MARLSARKLGVPFVGLVLLAGGGAWLERERLLTWYYLRGLARASETESNAWAERVASLGDAAVPGILECLTRDDAQACANARAALGRICAGVPQGDARWTDTTTRIVEAFPRLSVPGQRGVLTQAGEWLRPAAQPSAAALAYGTNLLNAASQTSDPVARAAALDIAAALLALESRGDALAPCRALARACMQDGDAHNRERAVHLALYSQLDLLPDVAGLLRDPAVEVRRAVVLAVGGSRAALSDERLALALHDADTEVRRLCEKALLGRGLTRRHIRLARLITDSRPATRLQVLFYLRDDSDLDVAVWLRLLTQDSAEAVRLAAVRAAAEHTVTELNERLEQMASSDPSPTVCRWARYYLGTLKQRQASNGTP